MNKKVKYDFKEEGIQVSVSDEEIIESMRFAYENMPDPKDENDALSGWLSSLKMLEIGTNPKSGILISKLSHLLMMNGYNVMFYCQDSRIIGQAGRKLKALLIPGQTDKFYIYAHRRSDTGQIFYIGKGFGGRAYNMVGRNSHHVNIQNKLARNGHQVQVEILESGLPEEAAFAQECWAIAYYKFHGEKLVNKTEGGEGASGLAHSEISKKLISAGIKNSHKIKKDDRRKFALEFLDCDDDEMGNYILQLSEEQIWEIGYAIANQKLNLKRYKIKPECFLLSHRMRA